MFALISINIFLNTSLADSSAQKMTAKEVSSQDLVRRAWEASGAGDLEKLATVVEQCVELYGQEAKEQQSALTGFPARGEENKYRSLNNVATCFFIHAEALMNTGKTEESTVMFQEIIEEYKWAQAWDPSRGNFWSVAEKSQASIDVILGKEAKGPQVNPNAVRSVIEIHNPGKEAIVSYAKYGDFLNVGTKNYEYKVTDPKGLSAAIGEGVYPNASAVFKDPHYRELRKQGRLKGSHWDYVNSEDLDAAYYKWLSAPEPWGSKLFYLGLLYEKSKLYLQAVKAYRALVVHFPTTVAWTYWQTPWYPAQAAIAKIKHILRIHPELNLEVKGMKIKVFNGFDNDDKNDVIVTSPGVVAEKTGEKEEIKVDLGKVKRRLGKGKVHLVQYENGHWQLIVDKKPYIIKGITYAPTKVGQSPDKGTLAFWMEEDSNENGIIDGPYEAWVDKNKNNKQDKDEPTVGDFQLMKEMGVNTMREYHQPHESSKKVLRGMYKKYGIRVIMGDFLGKYTLGSGATWFEGTDYENPEHRKNMMESVRKMVERYKKEPYILMWLLGNENNYGVASNADKKPVAYFKFVNEVAKMIKSIDKNHPVAVCNGDTLYLDVLAKYAPEVDIFAANAYRGDYGFGSFWDQVSDATGKPAFITEYGAPAYAGHLTLDEGEEAQAEYHFGNWKDIEENMAGTVEGVGNALGGVAFEWLDEWWKNYEPFRHDKKSEAIGPFPGGYYYEEWFGLIAQGDGQSSPFLRQPRKSYYTYQELWNKK